MVIQSGKISSIEIFSVGRLANRCLVSEGRIAVIPLAQSWHDPAVTQVPDSHPPQAAMESGDGATADARFYKNLFKISETV